MNTPRLTERVVTRARSRTAKYEITCKTVRGFILRVLPSGKKVYYVRYRTDGKDVRERLGTVAQLSFADARRRAVERLASVADDPSPAPASSPAVRRGASTNRVQESPLVREFAARFVAEHVSVRLKPNTQYKYRQALRTMISPRFGGRRLHEITRAEIIRWHGLKSDTPCEANYGLVVLKSLFSRAIEWGVLPEGFSSPATRVKRFPENARERYLTEDERARLAEFFKSATSKPFGRGGGYRWESICAIRLLAHTGMRRSEVLDLTWSMVDWEHSVLRLPDSKVGKRTVPLSPQALSVLLEARERNNPSPFVVPSSKGTAILGVTLSKTWIRIRKHVGLDDVRLHDLRHSAASDAVSNGVPLAVVGRILGHRKASTTQRYAHLCDEALERGVRIMGAVIEKKSKRRRTKK